MIAEVKRQEKNRYLPPLVYAAKVVLDPRCSLSSGARIVALAIARRMNVRPINGRHRSFPGVKRLAADTRLSPRTVTAKLAELRAMDRPLFKFHLGGRTHGYGHRSYEFMLVLPLQDAQTATGERSPRAAGVA